MTICQNWSIVSLTLDRLTVVFKELDKSMWASMSTLALGLRISQPFLAGRSVWRVWEDVDLILDPATGQPWGSWAHAFSLFP